MTPFQPAPSIAAPPLPLAAPSLPQQEVTGSEAFRRGKQAGAKRTEEAGAAGAKIAAEAGKCW